ncbi:DUF3748 domain-containing protein [Pedobacter arcticus]|uniref:DUF3748 domain-containing protein n=1 Tax=Pedobacter arcticus TaxID=752140 RepID=UPI0012B55F57|nr:DUF3748 domain-containing protein [Pedobacter arcticus]
MRDFKLINGKINVLYAIILCVIPCLNNSCNAQNMSYKERKLTSEAKGHLLNTTQCFSPDGDWLVYDTRNDDSKIGSTKTIEMININTGIIKELYHTNNQTEYGPGVGAATFSPTENKVIFIHGIRNSNKTNPYDFTRRTGVAIAVSKPLQPIFMDARDVNPPFTIGALRGGTHAHTWSGDGQAISYTYNDDVIAKSGKIKDLRTVGIMFPGKVNVADDGSLENNSGEMFSVIIANVTENPNPNSDEVDKAFDECWIGNDGYLKNDGNRQHRAIAFQGNVRNELGETVTDIFVVDLPADLNTLKAETTQGLASARLAVPVSLAQRRITKLKEGVKGPRHWLRTSADGRIIAFLSKDKAGYINAFGVSPNGGAVKQLSFHKFDIESGFNFSPDGKQLAYIADRDVYITDIETGESTKIADNQPDTKFTGTVVWSPDGKKLVYNKYVNRSGGAFLQIFVLEKED